MTATTVTLTDAIGTSDAITAAPHLFDNFVNSVGVTDVLTYVRTAVPYDTWRPVIRPDKHLILACRTPVGEHDSPTGLTHMTLWTFANTGDHENLEVSMDFGFALSDGWVSFAHPEWSPSGDDIVVAAETSTQYHIAILDATGFGA